MPQTAPSLPDARTFIDRVHGIRYQVTDVARAAAFYTGQLGFKLDHQHLPAFASVSLGDVQIGREGPVVSQTAALSRLTRNQET